MKGTISIIIPVYNAERCIARCAASLFGQTYGDIEYVFVDDCSSDRSIDVVQHTAGLYPQRRGQVKVVSHQCNRGVAAARNTGLDNATGEYLMFADSDDYMPADACATLLGRLEKTGADIVSGAFEKIMLDDVRVVVRQRHFTKKAMLKAMLTQSLVSANLWGRIYRRRLLAEHGFRWEEGVNMAEDYAMNAMMMYHARRLEYVDDIVYHYDFSRPPKSVAIYKPQSMQQLCRANLAVLEFYHGLGAAGADYWKAAQTGILFIYRNTLQGGGRQEDLAAFEPYVSAWMRPFIAGFSHKATFGLTNILYKAVRRIIVSL